MENEYRPEEDEKRRKGIINLDDLLRHKGRGEVVFICAEGKVQEIRVTKKF